MTATDRDQNLADRLWDVIAEVRDASPRLVNDADTYDVVDAVLPIVEAAQAEAWDACAEMAAHHGAFDGSRARWLSSVNPYTEKENNG